MRMNYKYILFLICIGLFISAAILAAEYNYPVELNQVYKLTNNNFELGNNRSIIQQTGNFNVANSYQWGRYNDSEIDQIGEYNQAYGIQIGIDNYLSIKQDGDKNYSFSNQKGVRNKTKIHQEGDNNNIRLINFSDDKKIVIQQFGNSQLFKIIFQ